MTASLQINYNKNSLRMHLIVNILLPASDYFKTKYLVSVAFAKFFQHILLKRSYEKRNTIVQYF